MMNFLLETVPNWLLANFGDIPYKEDYTTISAIIIVVLAVLIVLTLEFFIRKVSKDELY
jgi:hypothetical protein